jgi:hypothetical protein
MVRVKASVSEPRYGWGGVTHQMIGKITNIDRDGDLAVDFSPHRSNYWTGQVLEMELADGTKVNRNIALRLETSLAKTAQCLLF